MECLLLVITLAALVCGLRAFSNLKRAVRFKQWKRNRDRLTIEQYVQSLESEYYKAKMKDLYRGEK
jgi:hypothetical protein